MDQIRLFAQNQFLCLLCLQALGNHEFDNGPSGLEPFLNAVNFSVLSSNIDASKEPVINGLFNKSVVLNVGGEMVGIVGFTYSRTGEISNIGRFIVIHHYCRVLAQEVNSIIRALFCRIFRAVERVTLLKILFGMHP